MKRAIGMLELSPLDVLGDPLFPKRYYFQVMLPLLGILEAEPGLRLTLATTGSAIEYLAESHPLILSRVRALLEKAQIELLCSMYTNADWQSFPVADLLQSHRTTDAILTRNGLPRARTLVAQQNPYWPAMAAFHDEFDLYIVRDSFLRGRLAAPEFPGLARVGKSLLIVAANNILHDMAADFVSRNETGEIGLFTAERLENAVESWPHSDPRFVDISIGEDTWHWFHSVGAHHLTTSGGLRNWESFFCDPEWLRAVRDFLLRKLHEGSTFGLVSEFAAAVRTQIEGLPDLGDSGWAHNSGAGHGYWLETPEQRMRAASPWTSLAWRSRSVLRKAEAAVNGFGNGTRQTLRENLDTLWRHQLWAEVSPAVGRAVLPSEIECVRDHAEKVINDATEICLQLQPSTFLPHDAGGTDGMESFKSETAPVETEFINGEGSLKWFSCGNGIHRCEIQFSAEEPACGIGFKLATDRIEVSCFGQENELATVALTSFGDDGGVLSSPSGLYSLGNELYLIRHNHQLAVGAQFGSEGAYLRFIVDFAPEGRRFEWPFTLVQGSASTAIAMARQINAI